MLKENSPHIIKATAGFLGQVAAGKRLWTMTALRSIGVESGLDGALTNEVIETWIDQEHWLERFVLPGKKQERIRVMAQCPAIADGDADMCFMETVLELCGDKAHYSYRTALSLLGYSQENMSKTLVVTLPRNRQRPRPHADGVFERSNVRPAPWLVWQGYNIWRVERESTQVDAFKSYATDGLPVSSIERCLLDCWLRPVYGVSDDRLVDAYRQWWEDTSNASLKQKARHVAQVFHADQDNRLGRHQQYTDFLSYIAEDLGVLFNEACENV